jgi:hypothetical protein
MTRCLWCLAGLLPVVALAQPDTAFECTMNDLVRRLEIVYETDAPVPCEVRYSKLSEAPGRTDVLWRARNESGYCESRARAFVAELEAWGWRCADAGTVPEPAVIDDTAVLSAPER